MRQQDSHELLRYLLDGIDTEDKKRIKSQSPSDSTHSNANNLITLNTPSPITTLDSTSSINTSLSTNTSIDQNILSSTISSENTNISEGKQEIENKKEFEINNQISSSNNDSINTVVTNSNSDNNSNVISDSNTKDPISDNLSNGSIKSETRKSKSKSVIEEIFGGKISSKIICLKCGTSSEVLDPCLDLSLPIPDKFLDSKQKSRGKGNTQPNKVSIHFIYLPILPATKEKREYSRITASYGRKENRRISRI
jgi:hypothetical protein